MGVNEHYRPANLIEAGSDGVAPDSPEVKAFMDAVEAKFKKHFPNGFFQAWENPRFGASMSIHWGLLGNKQDLPSGYRENDPFHHNLKISTDPRTEMFNARSEFESLSSALYLNPPEGSHLAMERLKGLKLRKVTGDLDRIQKALFKYIETCAKAVKDNQDNIYGADRMNPKYLKVN